MMLAHLSVPLTDHDYPWRAAVDGLRNLGYDVESGRSVSDGDLLVVWTPWNGTRRAALEAHYKRQGKPVIVMENGWLSPIQDKPFYQVALDGWNGTGRFASGDGRRWDSWGVKLAPWREWQMRTLICGQRGHPTDPRTSPIGWHQTVDVAQPEAAVIRRGRDALRPLSADIAAAHVAHVWSSNAASHAIVAGVRVVQHGPNLMVSALASLPGEPFFAGDREPELRRLAWAQFSEDEIRTGEPFARLLT